METNEENNVTAILAVDDITNMHLKLMIECLQLVVDAEIPTPADSAFLMEVMTKLAGQQREKDNVVFKVRMDEKTAAAVWHCLNITILNKMLPSEGHVTVASQALSYIAIKLDQLLVMNESPRKLELV